MIKFLMGAAFAMTVLMSLIYGFQHSLTAEGFVVQGYFGAILPASWVMIGFFIGSWANK